MTRDMTQGSPVRLILTFSLPLLIGNIFQQLYNMVDTMIVGRFVSTQALAGVGSTGAISFLIMGFAMGVTSGFSVVISQRFGANDEKGLRNAVAMSVYLCIALTVVMTLVSTLATRPLLMLMNTPDDMFADAYNYIFTIFLGMAAPIFYNMLAGILRALGDSRTPLYFLILSSLLNVGLDLLFIITFHMGVVGAAVATIISQVVSGLLCLLYVAKRFPILRFQKGDWKLNWSLIGLHLKIGLPMAFQFSITAIGVMAIQGAINSFGSNAAAGYTAASKVEQICTQPMNTFGVTMATYAGQNLGAARIDRVKEGVWKCAALSTVVSVIVTLLVFVAGDWFVTLFVGGNEPEVMAYARQYMYITSVFYFMLGLLFVFRNALQGMGASMVTLVGGGIELVLRTAIAFILPPLIGFTGICVAGPSAWIGASVPLIIVFLILIPRYQRKYAPRPDPPEEAPV